MDSPSMMSGSYKAREHRITASVFGDVLSRMPSTKPDVLVTRIIRKGRDLDTPALQYGREMEEVALQAYTSKMNGNGHPGLSVERCGFFISSFSFSACSLCSRKSRKFIVACVEFESELWTGVDSPVATNFTICLLARCMRGVTECSRC